MQVGGRFSTRCLEAVSNEPENLPSLRREERRETLICGKIMEEASSSTPFVKRRAKDHLVLGRGLASSSQRT